MSRTEKKDYLIKLDGAKPEKGSALPALLPAIFFTAFVIVIVRVKNFKRPMTQFDWTPQSDNGWLNDFFSYYKMVAILVCSGLALFILLLFAVRKTLLVKRTPYYIPMMVYSAFVVLSYVLSDLKEFALLGWNERFEGTLPVLGYIIMMFFIINTVNSEKNVKQLVWPLAVSSLALNILGLFQSFGRDLFATRFGQKLLSANYDLGDTMLYDAIDAAADAGEPYFTFEFSNASYQTVYNPNYVSFYLSLLVPFFTLLLLRALQKDSHESIFKKFILLGILGLQIFNILASRSIGGYVGLTAAFVVALVVLNKKLFKWAGPICFLIIVAGTAGYLTFDSWYNEIAGTVDELLHERTVTEREVTASIEELEATAKPASVRPYFDYLYTDDYSIETSIFGNPLTIGLLTNDAGNVSGIKLHDADGNFIPVGTKEDHPNRVIIYDNRYYEYLTIDLSADSNFVYITLKFKGGSMAFPIVYNDIYYQNPYGNLISLDRSAEARGFSDRLGFGSGRGYIWSRSIPLLKETPIVGYGADTFCAHFPQYDYTGRFNAGFSMGKIVDKPHCMYLGMALNTGLVSLAAFLVMYIIYFVQSMKIYIRRDFGTDYLCYAGCGIFLGVTGFLAAALVNDSTVSVMPVFYGLYGTGIAINFLLKKRDKAQQAEETPEIISSETAA